MRQNTRIGVLNTLGLGALALASAAGVAQGQQFQRTVGTPLNEASNDLKTTRDMGWINVGTQTPTTGLLRMLAVKHQPTTSAAPGSIQWDAAYQTDGRCVAHSVVQVPDSTFVMSGESDIFGANNLGLSLTRVDPIAGNIIWAWLYRGTPFSAAAGTAVTTSVDGVLAVGQLQLATTAPRMGVLLKARVADGSVIFERSYSAILPTGATGNLVFSDVRELPDTSIVISATLGDGVQTDAVIIRTDPLGNVLTAFAYGSPNFNEAGDGIDYDGGNRVVLSGRSNIFGPAFESTFVMTADAFGLAPFWMEHVRDITNGFAAVRFAPDNTVSVAGSVNLATGAVFRDAVMVRLTPAGAPVWGWRYGKPTTDDFFESGIPTPYAAGGFAGAGSTTLTGFGGTDIYFTQADNTGSTGCLETPFPLNLRPSTIFRPISVVSTFNSVRTAFPLNKVAPLDRDDILCFTPDCPCVADFDGSGGVPDAGDIAAFFAAWLLGDPASDADCSGGTPDAADVAQFFAEWLAGGC